MSDPATTSVLIMHPTDRSLHPGLVRVGRDGLALSRLSPGARTERDLRSTGRESEPITIAWRALRGFCADASFVTPDGRRLQVVEVDSEEGVLTLLAPVAEVSALFGAVSAWARHWRLARSPFGVVFGGRRRRIVRQVA